MGLEKILDRLLPPQTYEYRKTEKFIEFSKLTHVISRTHTKYAQYIPRYI
jgi:hypothetical protein